MKELYWVTISYDLPCAGTVSIYADSEEQAKDILAKAHEKMKDYKVIDIYKLTEEQIKMMTPQGMLDFGETETEKGKLN